MPVLTAIDVLGVQRYIFATNRLRDIAAASWLVDWAVGEDGALKEVGTRPKDILFAGGGNALLLFHTLSDAKEFAEQYSKKLYLNAPDLEVALVHREYESGRLAYTLQGIQKELVFKKMSRKPNTPLLGISVTANCSQTGLPAVATDKGMPISRRVQVFNDCWNKLAKKWRALLDGTENVTFPTELDKLGRTHGDTSFLAVVHMDGNQIGQKLQNWFKTVVAENISDQGLIEKYRTISESLDEAATLALKAVVQRVCQAIEYDQKGKPVIRDSRSSMEIRLQKEQGKICLPIRPILLGGDDITFVCDARLAHDAIATALRTYEAQCKNVPELYPLSACAGAALIHTHSPFIRGYETAERLCSRAKQKAREKKEKDRSYLDWHIGLLRPGESLEEAYDRQYKTKEHDLSCRPYAFTKEVEPDSWDWFENTLLGTGQHGLRSSVWMESHNKIKALPSLARHNVKILEQTLASWQAINPNLNFPSPIENKGFKNTRTPLIDAVELIDIYMNLNHTASKKVGQEGA
jgi:hypothetical protein